MAGTRIGGMKAAAKNLEKDPHFYEKIGALGGSRRVEKGFALMDADTHKAASAKGGRRSRRGKAWENSTATESNSSTPRTTPLQPRSSASEANAPSKPSKRRWTELVFGKAYKQQYKR